MSNVRREKEEVVASIKEKLEQSQAVVLTNYRGLTVAEIDELRKKFREANVEYRVLKNTLTWLAAKEIGLEDIKDMLEGPTAIAFGYDDPVAPAKVIADFSKNHKALELKGGILEGQVQPIERIKALAELPSKEELLAQVAGVFQAPISSLAYVLQAPISSFAMAAEALRVKKEQEA